MKLLLFLGLFLLLTGSWLYACDEEWSCAVWDEWYYNNNVFFFQVSYFKINPNFVWVYTCGDVGTCYGISV